MYRYQNLQITVLHSKQDKKLCESELLQTALFCEDTLQLSLLHKYADLRIGDILVRIRMRIRIRTSD